jgi:hypothetical protein
MLALSLFLHLICQGNKALEKNKRAFQDISIPNDFFKDESKSEINKARSSDQDACSSFLCQITEPLCTTACS